MTKKERETMIANGIDPDTLKPIEAVAEPAAPESKVTLPGLTKLAKGVGVGVDSTYTKNVAVFKLGTDGMPAAKRDGSLRKPIRIPEPAARAIAENPAEVLALCEEIRAAA